MYCVTLGASPLNQTPLDWKGNTRNIIAAINRARARGVRLLCLPELCVTGYGCEDHFFSTSVLERAWKVVEEVAQLTEGIAVTLGVPVRHGNALYNAVCLVADRVILGVVAKQHLAGDGVYYEPRWFKPWPAGVMTYLHDVYPFGDLTFDLGGVRIGFEICEDAWVSTRPGRELASLGVDVILNPSASHFVFGKHAVRKAFVCDGSRAFGVAYVYCNLLGCEAGRIIYDGDALISSQGIIVSQGTRFSMQDVELTTAVVDLDVNRVNQSRIASRVPSRTLDDRCVSEPGFSLESQHAPSPSPAVGGPDYGMHLKEEEFTRGVTLGLFDYLRKSRINGFVISLSGGADSSAVSVLVSYMVHRGWRELGRDGMLSKLNYIEGIRDAVSVEELSERLLRCVYQKSEHSSRETREAARGVADAIHAQFHEFDISELVTQYEAMVSRALGRELTWERDDAARQNVQARVRSPGIWLLANATNSLLLTTSNRSEGSVGYATMDGDTSGGFNPIGGVDKAFLRRWLSWVETTGPERLHPIAALSHVNRLQPTAELRPLERKQTDEADLMPYEVLQMIERCMIVEKKDPIECYLVLKPLLSPRYDDGTVRGWIARFFRLWSVNQWKRERLAPSFNVDEYNIDPRSWCRFPILTAGFTEELGELELQ